MRVFVVIALLCTSLSIPSFGREPTQQEERELEKFYGAEYVHVSDAEHKRLVRDAIRAQRTGICNIHHIRMQKKRLPLYFGLLVFDDPYYSAELVYFPNAREHVNGGCQIDPVWQKQPHFRYVCSECKRAQREWAIAHPKSDWSKDVLAKR